jgi:Leucine-rich repeat (LRR) protein
MAENSLQDCLPPSISNLNQLEILELQGNKLTALPDEIQDLVQLRTLNISHNKVRSLPARLLSSATSLIDLIATNNAFSGTFFPAHITTSDLQALNLSSNALTCLAETAISLPSLKSLDVSINRLTEITSDISSWTSLDVLHAAENKLVVLPPGFTSLMTLRMADFSSNDIRVVDQRVSLMEGLENLNLAANPLRDRKFLTMDTESVKRELFGRLDPEEVSKLRGAEEAEVEEVGRRGPMMVF